MTRINGRVALTISEACHAAGVARRTIYYWMGAKKIDFVRTPGGSPRIFLDTLWRDADGQPLQPKDST